WVMCWERRLGAESRVAIVSSCRCRTIIASLTRLSSDRGHPGLREHPGLFLAPVAQDRRRLRVPCFFKPPRQILCDELARLVAFVPGGKLDRLEPHRGQVHPQIPSHLHVAAVARLQGD